MLSPSSLAIRFISGSSAPSPPASPTRLTTSSSLVSSNIALLAAQHVCVVDCITKLTVVS
jgi:hypothetical protein